MARHCSYICRTRFLTSYPVNGPDGASHAPPPPHHGRAQSPPPLQPPHLSRGWSKLSSHIIKLISEPGTRSLYSAQGMLEWNLIYFICQFLMYFDLANHWRAKNILTITSLSFARPCYTRYFVDEQGYWVNNIHVAMGCIALYRMK